jgi:hypothetical protein
VSQADKKENEKLEYDWDKDLIANVFKSGFNWHAPYFEGVKVWPHTADNYAALIDVFKFTKFFSMETKLLTGHDNNHESDTIKV